MQSDKAVSLKIFDFLPLYPEAIRSMHINVSESRIHIARETYSDVYHLNVYQGTINIYPLARLEACDHLLSIGGHLIMFLPFALRVYRNESWETHAFTTQFISIRVEGDKVYSFHHQYSICWCFAEDDFGYEFLRSQNTPFHLTAEGSIEGYGKKLLPEKGHQFTCCEVLQKCYIFVGDHTGNLQIYDFKNLMHLTTFKRHAAAILTIVINEHHRAVYWSGSDSKVVGAKYISGEWQLSEYLRGQSHDVMSLSLLDNYLLAGGLTTDICFYELVEGQIKGYCNKVSYSSYSCLDWQGKYLLVNRRASFELWYMSALRSYVQLLVKYEMPSGKNVKWCRLSKKLKSIAGHLILVGTEYETIGWKFDPETGLVKHVTINSGYYRVEFITNKNIFLALKSNNEVEKVFCKSGKIDYLFRTDVELPTSMKLLADNCVLITSTLTCSLQVFNTRTKYCLLHYCGTKSFTYVDRLDYSRLLIKYCNDSTLYSLKVTADGIDEMALAILPIKSVRFGGWLDLKADHSGQGKYWYAISEGKIAIVTNLGRYSKKAKIRVKQTVRISYVVQINNSYFGFNLAIIPLNFKRMIDELPIKPVFTKKIV